MGIKLKIKSIRDSKAIRCEACGLLLHDSVQARNAHNSARGLCIVIPGVREKLNRQLDRIMLGWDTPYEEKGKW